MTAGEKALAGNPEMASQIGSNLRGRTLGSEVAGGLSSASSGLGSQSGSSVSSERIQATIQASAVPAYLV